MGVWGRGFSAFCLLSMLAAAQDIRLQGVTATQAVLAYTAPDSQSCRIEASESPDYLPPVHDVNAGLFAGANRDLERRGTIVSGRDRIVVIGRRTAETAADRKRYSRALRAYTTHYVRVTCGNGIAREISFDTTNIPVGQTYNEPLPADPAKPGETAWPTIDWNDRNQWIIDPKTGLAMRRVTSNEESVERYPNNNFAAGRDLEGAWSNPQAITANDNNFASASTPGWLFLQTNWSIFVGGTRDYNVFSLDAYSATLNAWCDGCDTSSASRTIETCVTLDGFRCAGKTLETVLENCSANCTQGTRYRIEIGAGGPPMEMAWGLQDYDITEFHRRTGQARRTGSRLEWLSGNVFSIRWKAGTKIRLGDAEYTIAKVENEKLITLDGDFAANTVEGPATWVFANFGVLVRRKTAGPGEVRIQHAQWMYQTSNVPEWEAGAELETVNSCSPVMTEGPGGEMGWHCTVGRTVYWIGGDSGTVNRLASVSIPSRGGTDGWFGDSLCRPFQGGGPLWDAADPNVFYCGQSDNFGASAILRIRYVGDNRDMGPLDTYSRLKECNATRSNAPCWELSNLTPGSRGMGLRQQLEKLYPSEMGLLRSASAYLTSRRGRMLQFIVQRGNNLLAMVGLFDPGTGLVAGAVSSWKTWPLRWAGIHGVEPMLDDQWMPVPATFFRGDGFATRDFSPGNGPYFSRVTSGAIPATGADCPARPANSVIPPHEWPMGSRCLEITVDGEPGDPSPFYYNDGTITTNGGAVTGTNTAWDRNYDGMPMRIAGQWYRFTYVSPTSGRIAPEPDTPFRNATYELYLDQVNSGRTANPAHAYLQDAEVRDYVAIGPSPYPSFLLFQTEVFRILIKNGNRWTLERALGGSFGQMLRVPADAYAVMIPTSCLFQDVYFCYYANAVWNTLQDPAGKNQTGTSIVADSTVKGSGHSSSGPLASVYSVADKCPSIDGLGYSCYNIRPGATYPERAAGENYTVSLNPPFNGRVAIGIPNVVDSHPAYKQLSGVADDLSWIVDARPFLGYQTGTGSAARPGVLVEEGLWKFDASQTARLRPKHMPVLASCGSSPLRDVSGPDSRIAGDGSYTYCIAARDGECRSGSAAGDVFVSCPAISTPYCAYPGIALAGADTRDICIMDNGSRAQAITQTRFTEPENDGRNSRVLTNGLARYRFNDVFWNPRTTPDGKWLLFRTLWLDEKRGDAFIAKLPPMDGPDGQVRNGYRSVELQIGPGEADGQAGAMIEFGYNERFECTTRLEACVAGDGTAADGEPFYFATAEKWTPVSCAAGCTLRMPVIGQRVVYFRIRYFDAGGQEIARSAANVWAFD